MDSKDQSQCDNNAVVSDFLDACKFPALTSAKIITVDDDNKYYIQTNWSQRCIERSTSVKFRKFYTLDKISGNSKLCSTPIDVSNELVNCVSCKSNYTALLRETKLSDTKEGKKVYLEIWEKDRLYQTHNLTLLDIHGDVYTDDTFGSCCWCPFEKRLFYVAEEKKAKMEPFYKASGQKHVLDDSIHGREYEYMDDWGEQFSPKRQSVIVICDKDTRELSVLSNIPSDICPGGIVWKPDGKGFFGVGYSNTNRSGLIYCTCRESYIFDYSLDTKQYRTLTKSGNWVSSPRVSPDGRYLVWLQREATGAHHNAVRLIKFDIASETIKTIVDTIADHISIKNDKKFYGLYAIQLTPHCWLRDSKHVILSTPQNYQTNIYLINTETGEINEISRDGESCNVLDVFDDVILCSVSNFKRPSRLYGLISVDGFYTKWIAISNEYVIDEDGHYEVRYIDLKADPSDVVTDYGAIYLGPSSGLDRSIPLILMPHGGPHSVYTNSFSAVLYYFIKSGFAVALVNYRGSVGYGAKSVEYLLGRVGTTDVRDVYNALCTVIQRYEFLDDQNVFLFGGSHGGFLVTHLSGQYPHSFTAVVTINPVTHMSAMLSVTDIPDWAVVECGMKYEGLEKALNSSELVAKMHDMSPLKYVKNVKAPTLLLLGKKDLRVPSSQGLLYYKSLKENNVATKVLYYEDNHSLGTVLVEMDSIINTIIWFKKYHTEPTTISSTD